MKRVLSIAWILFYSTQCDTASPAKPDPTPNPIGAEYTPELSSDCLTGTWRRDSEYSIEGSFTQTTKEQFTLHANTTAEVIYIDTYYEDPAKTVFDESLLIIQEGIWSIENGLFNFGLLNIGGSTDDGDEFDFTEAESITDFNPLTEIKKDVKTAACGVGRLATGEVYAPRFEGQVPELKGEWICTYNSFILEDGEFKPNWESTYTYNFDPVAMTVVMTIKTTGYRQGHLEVKPGTEAGRHHIELAEPERSVFKYHYTWQDNGSTLLLASCDSGFTSCGDLTDSNNEIDYTFIQDYLVLSSDSFIYTKEE